MNKYALTLTSIVCIAASCFASAGESALERFNLNLQNYDQTGNGSGLHTKGNNFFSTISSQVENGEAFNLTTTVTWVTENGQGATSSTAGNALQFQDNGWTTVTISFDRTISDIELTLYGLNLSGADRNSSQRAGKFETPTVTGGDDNTKVSVTPTNTELANGYYWATIPYNGGWGNESARISVTGPLTSISITVYNNQFNVGGVSFLPGYAGGTDLPEIPDIDVPNVPEPATVATLLGGAALAAAMIIRRKRKA